jgi:hypothetical protein
MIDKIANNIQSLILWLFTYEHIFTLATVVLSGLISWYISARYFKKANRDALRANVLFPIKRILVETRSWKNYNKLLDISKNYNSKYLNSSEQKTMDELILSYKSICNYDYDFACAESLFSYFCYTLKQNGINTEPVPIYVENELVDWEVPDGMLYMRDDIARIINMHPPRYEDEECLPMLIKLFNSYSKEYYTDKKIEYFKDFTLDEVIKKSKSKNIWDEKFATYKKSEEAFLNIMAFKE